MWVEFDPEVTTFEYCHDCRCDPLYAIRVREQITHDPFIRETSIAAATAEGELPEELTEMNPELSVPPKSTAAAKSPLSHSNYSH